MATRGYYRSPWPPARSPTTANPPWPQADLPPLRPRGSSPQLSAGKARCTTVELRHHSPMAMARTAEPDSAAYFTNPDRSRTGGAAITSGIELVTRTQDHYQTELLAIQLALEHTHQ